MTLDNLVAGQFNLLLSDQFLLLPSDVSSSTTPNFTQILGMNWSDGATNFTATVLHAGNVVESTNTSIASNSATERACGTDFSTGNAGLILMFIIAAFTQDVGALSVTMNTNYGSPVMVDLFPNEPFVWSSMLIQSNPLIPDGITSFVFNNPNSKEAEVRMRILAAQ